MRRPPLGRVAVGGSGWERLFPLVGSVLVAAASAGQPAPAEQGHDIGADEFPLDDGERWRLTFRPYLWTPSFSGDITAGGLTAPIDIQFLDLFRESDSIGALQGVVTARRGRLGFFLDGSLVFAEKNGLTGSVAGIDLDADLTIRISYLEAGASFIAHEISLAGAESETPDDDRGLFFDVIAGGRATWLDGDLDLKASKTLVLPNGKIVGEVEEEFARTSSRVWVDPFVGVGLAAELPRSLVFRGKADVGGFGAGSEFSWQAVGALGWRFEVLSTDGLLYLGYRAIYQRYQDGGFEWDMTLHGPMIGLMIRF